VRVAIDDGDRAGLATVWQLYKLDPERPLMEPQVTACHREDLQRPRRGASCRCDVGIAPALDQVLPCWRLTQRARSRHSRQSALAGDSVRTPST
jgi:hypothetical protein